MRTVFSTVSALVAATALGVVNADQTVFTDLNDTTPSSWGELSTQVEGRLLPGKPYASVCFPDDPDYDSALCDEVEKNYLDEFKRTMYPSAQIQPQWEGCQRLNEQCLLDWTNPTNDNATKAPYRCSTGSVSGYYIDVRIPQDVQYAFRFSKSTGVPLVIKNTGHDYKGRSSAPNTLALWTHNLKEISYNAQFVPEGTDEKPRPGVTMQAGVQWKEAYAFAEANKLTLVGGSDEAVGSVGGWLQGGGQGALTNTLGMGVDRVLQFKVVTPDGEYRIANKKQNPDLFWALRGGGGGTFGVVMEATMLAEPHPVTLQTTYVSWKNVDKAQSTPLTRELFKILIDNGLKWADEGYGGFVWPETIIYITPKLNKEEATKTMDPLLKFGNKLKSDNIPGAAVLQLEFPSWLTFYNTFAAGNAAKVGIPLALTSRLIQRESFATEKSRAELLDAVMKAHALTPSFRFLLAPPSSFPGEPGATSINPAWRNSIFHATLVSSFNFNTTSAEREAVYARASKAISYLRDITPDAAYSNESDIFEPNHKVAFWGDNYAELLRIKKKYDPDHLLDCWHCVGYQHHSARFSCYPKKVKFHEERH